MANSEHLCFPGGCCCVFVEIRWVVCALCAFFFKISDGEGLPCKGFVCWGFECFCLRFFHWFYRFPSCLIVCIPGAQVT